jgi:hypothetical protein
MHEAVLQRLYPEHEEVEICRAAALAQCCGLTSERDAMWCTERCGLATEHGISRS